MCKPHRSFLCDPTQLFFHFRSCEKSGTFALGFTRGLEIFECIFPRIAGEYFAYLAHIAARSLVHILVHVFSVYFNAYFGAYFSAYFFVLMPPAQKKIM